MELARRGFKNNVAMLPSHRDDDVGRGGNLGLQLPRGESGWVSAHLLKDTGRIPVNRVPDYRAGSGTGRCEVRDPMLGGIGGGKSLPGGGATYVACADEQDVHGQIPR